MNEAIVWAIVFAVLIAVLEWFYHATIRRWRKIVTAMIEIVIYPRSDPDQKKLLRNLLKSVGKDDEILFVGRTHARLLNEDEDVAAILGALKRGALLKFLLLNTKLLENSHIGRQVDLRSLRLPDAYGLMRRDLGRAEAKLRKIRGDCEKNKCPGSLLIHRTELVIQSSVVIHARKARSKNDGDREVMIPIRFLYDFSFGDEEADKFTQYYKPHRKLRPSDFCSRLYKFYSSMLDPDVSSFDFSLSYRPFTNNLQSELGRFATQRWKSFVEYHTESEDVRRNQLRNILPSAAEVFKALRDTRVPSPPPVSVQVELTNKCSTECEHCFRWNKTSQTEMNPALAKKVFDELSDFNVKTITLSGGEPTQHPEFIDLLGYASQKNLAIGVLSNGVGISDDALRAIHRHARWLRLSVDGSSATIYGQIRHSRRGETAFNGVKSTLERFKQYNEKGESCSLRICYTIQKSNAHDVPEMIRMVRDMRLPEKSLTFKFAHGEGDFVCTEDQIRELQELFKNKEFAHAANLDYLEWFLENQSSVLDVSRGYPTESLYRSRDTRCFTPHLFALIDPKGDVYPCCFLFEDNSGYNVQVETKRRKHWLGNVGSQSFAEIWYGKSRDANQENKEFKTYPQVRDELAIIDPSRNNAFGGYKSCGKCTRHCNHNRWLSILYREYDSLYGAGGDGDEAVDVLIKDLLESRPASEVWL